MATLEDTLTWRGSDMLDSQGDKIGSIEEIYLDAETNQPEWALVNTGMFGTKRSFVPLREASPEDDGIRVPYEKSQVKDAPSVEPDGQLSQDEESRSTPTTASSTASRAPARVCPRAHPATRTPARRATT